MSESPQFLRYRHPPMLTPRLSSRQHRETLQRASGARQWGNAAVIAGIVIAVLCFVFVFMLTIGSFE